LWAGFRRSRASYLRGEGQKFEQLCDQSQLSPTALFKSAELEFEGLKLYPLDWVAGQLEQATAVFADLSRFRQPRVFRLQRFPEDLVGQIGAMTFDFLNSPHRQLAV
jgi:hypothetical protein